MILKTLKVQNIRSLKDIEIEFPQTTILFHGDIGSGKSSVLKAIEFALLGTLKAGDLEGSSLLRRGEKTAEVTLTFIIDGKEYTVNRKLKRAKSGITQPAGWLDEEGEEVKYSTRELKSKILSLLNYSVSRYEKTQSVDIFRYTVYTPQEEIKYILEADAKERFDHLKDVLEIERYENTLKNLKMVNTRLNQTLRDKRGDLKRIGEPEEKISPKEVEITVKTVKTEEQRKKISQRRKEKEEQEKKLDTLREEIKTHSNKLTEISEKENQINKAKKSLEKNKTAIADNQVEIKQTLSKLQELPEIKLKTKEPLEDLQKEITALRKKKSQENEEKGTINGKIGDIQSLLEKGICALCGQTIHEKPRFDQELEKAKEKVKEITQAITSKEEKIQSIDELMENLRVYQANEKLKKSFQGILKEKQKLEENLKDTQQSLMKAIKENQQDIQTILKIYDIEKFISLEGKIRERVQVQKQQVKAMEEEVVELEKEQVAIKKDIQQIQEEIEKLKMDIQKKKQILEQIAYVGSVQTWVSDALPVLLKDIERNVLTATATHFNTYFKEWFQVLVEEENIDIEINPENFEPLIMVNGYESPLKDLSGGEKSAISLAYRLALNKVITSKHQDVKTKDLLILDEPTDGFSQQQINKMQDIFEGLDTKQMIIISHERTLESFVTEVFNFSKQHHKTTVTRE